jgi:hypothetical protein
LFSHFRRSLSRLASQTLIKKTIKALVLDPVRRHVDRRANTADFLLDLLRRIPLSQKQRDAASLCFNAALRPMHQGGYFLTLRSGQLNKYLHSEKSPGFIPDFVVKQV